MVGIDFIGIFHKKDWNTQGIFIWKMERLHSSLYLHFLFITAFWPYKNQLDQLQNALVQMPYTSSENSVLTWDSLEEEVGGKHGQVFA